MNAAPEEQGMGYKQVEDAELTMLTVRRGMLLLRAFKSDRAPLSNAELVRRTGLSKPAVSRLTTMLQRLGLLRRVVGGRAFELGVAPLGVGEAFLGASEWLRVANPVLRDLADRLGVAVALAVQDQGEMLYVAHCASARVATLRLGVGSVVPIPTTASGRAYLWGLPPARRRALLAELLSGEAGETGEARDVLARCIEDSFRELEAKGTCAVASYHWGSAGVALPVFLGRDKVLMSLSAARIALPDDLGAEHARITGPLRETAHRLTALTAGLADLP